MKRKQALSLLGLNINANIDQINSTYKSLAVQYYKNINEHSEKTKEEFGKITKAYLWLYEKELPIKKSDKKKIQELKGELNLALKLCQSYGSKDNFYPDDNRDLDSNSQEPSEKDYQELVQALLEEEEKDKRKAEKKKAYKKRRKERKKLNVKENKIDSKGDSEQEKYDSTCSESEDVLNSQSAFNSTKDSSSKSSKEKDSSSSSSSSSEEDTQDCIENSMQLAIQGNQKATMEEYRDAIKLFTKAIELNTTDFRYFGNRSYCYDRLGCYEKALEDAEKAISLQSNAPKGYFRKGRALVGLKRYAEAEKAFEEVLSIESECVEALQELHSVQVLQLVEMGFSMDEAEEAITNYGSVPSALDSLLSFESMASPSSETSTVTPKISLPPIERKKEPNKIMSNGNSLWVGNVMSEISEKGLQSLFSQYGDVLSVRIIPGSFCAFVNFTNSTAALNAKINLQGKELGGKNLKIKFPENSGGNSLNTSKSKGLGPVQTSQGSECRFFRLANCMHGSNCFYKHIKEHKGIDLTR